MSYIFKRGNEMTFNVERKKKLFTRIDDYCVTKCGCFLVFFIGYALVRH